MHCIVYSMKSLCQKTLISKYIYFFLNDTTTSVTNQCIPNIIIWYLSNYAVVDIFLITKTTILSISPNVNTFSLNPTMHDFFLLLKIFLGSFKAMQYNTSHFLIKKCSKWTILNYCIAIFTNSLFVVYSN